ncbi:MAG: alpha/beta fold hydrolase [Gemmatimonadetes bacterium]|nr:alpha/beta fold hydrolase [Gemmatimonadota bacterium]NIO30971.1 alpha/beta fold hydrolase [Gemmatimonadota bacterium]
MQTQRLTFRGATGDLLSARLELPVDEKPIAYALFAHCFTCSKNFKAVVHISRALAQARIGVLRFDFTGLGESEGDFSDTTFSSNVEDLIAAAQYMEQEWEAPAILIGHSLGGAAVLQAAHHIHACRAVVTIAAPAEPQHVMRHLKSSLNQIQEFGSAEVELAGRTFTIKKEFLADLDRQNMEEVIGTLNRALLVFHSPADAVVGAENAARIYETAREPKSHISLKDADHLLSNSEDSQYVGAVIAAWATRYLGAPAVRQREEPVPLGQAVVRTGQARYHTEILTAGHPLVSDEPESVGGTDTGPNPFGLLMAALGACTTITLRMYADRKEWPLEEIGVHLQHTKLKTSDAKTNEISQTLELVGPLSAEQRERLLEIAHRCPVHRALEAGVLMPMSLKEEGDPV